MLSGYYKLLADYCWFEWLEDEILNVLITVQVYYHIKSYSKKRYKYSGIKLKLFHFDREK